MNIDDMAISSELRERAKACKTPDEMLPLKNTPSCETETVQTPYNHRICNLAGASRPACREGGRRMDFSDLSPELREKAKACNTPEEMLALAKQEGYKLSDEEMEGIAGGWSCDSFGERSDCHLNQWYE